MSGKDIRRLVACGTVSSNTHKINIILRLLLGLEAADVSSVAIMPDAYGIGLEAREKFFQSKKSAMKVWFLDMQIKTSHEDSYRASHLLRDLGIGCIITLGGDGTNRLVAKGCGDVPILPISTGTNNVFPFTVEATVAGMAAGLVSRHVLVSDQILSHRKTLDILRDDEVIDIALIDAVVLRARGVGTRAVWDVGQIKQIVQTCGCLSDIGLSSIGGCLHNINICDGHGLSVEIGEGGCSVLAPIAPGLIKEVNVKSVRVIEIGETVPVRFVPSILALDGEREFRIKSGDKISIRLSRSGLRVVEVHKVLKLATENGFFRTCRQREVKTNSQISLQTGAC
jgi:hypothetical protein